MAAALPALLASGLVGTDPPVATAGQSPIDHVVVIIMENQSFDAMLGRLCSEQASGQIVRAGNDAPCDGSTVGTLPNGAPFPLQAEPDSGLKIDHGVYGQTTSIDGGAMDGFDKISGCTPTSKLPYGCLSQFDALGGTCGLNGKQSCIPDAATLATDYAISDRTFELRGTPSWTGHMALAAATIESFKGTIPVRGPSGIPHGQGWGCDSGEVAQWFVDALHKKTVLAPSCIPDASGSLGPLWDHTVYASKPHAYYVPTLFDRMDAAGVSWRIYEGSYGWSMCPTFEECLDSSQRARMVTVSKLFTDTAGGTLPQVSMVVPGNTTSEHQPQSISKGDAWIGQLVSAIQHDTAQWGSTAILLTWDDCGCFYDHVNPLQYDPEWGLRLPLILISPWAKPGFTDSTPTAVTSILTFIEHIFGLSPLNPCADDPDPACTDDLVGPGGTPAYDYMGAFDFGRPPALAPTKLVTSVRLPERERRWLAAAPKETDDPT